MYGINLEQYLETLEGLPNEMKQKFMQMRDLDRKVVDNLRFIDDASHKYIIDYTGLSPNEKTERQKGINRRYKKCKDWSDTKIQLAVQTYEMVDKHIRRLDAELAKFEAKLKHKAAIIAASNAPIKNGSIDNVPASKPVAKRKLFQKDITTTDGKNTGKKSGVGIGKGIRSRKKIDLVEDDETPRMDLKSTKKRSAATNAVALNNRDLVNSGKAIDTSNLATSPSKAADGSIESLMDGNSASPTNLPSTSAATTTFSHTSQILDMPVDPNEPTYCVCHQVSYGEMIGCDNPDCLVEWFHFGCVNLTHKPKGKWYCPTCAPLFAGHHHKKRN